MTRRVTTLLGLLSLTAFGMLAGDELIAQVPFSTACQTHVGICPINPSPINSACRCFNDPGRVVHPPPDWGRFCRTPQGVCQFWPLPVGSPCACNGNVPGQVSR
jgi:hypothetical protein